MVDQVSKSAYHVLVGDLVSSEEAANGVVVRIPPKTIGFQRIALIILTMVGLTTLVAAADIDISMWADQKVIGNVAIKFGRETLLVEGGSNCLLASFLGCKGIL